MTWRLGRARPISAGPVTPSAGDDGMVTAEFAVALPAFVLVVVAAIAAVAVVIAQLRCVDAASIAARMAARGEPAASLRSAAFAGVPGTPTLEVSAGGDTVTATVASAISAPGILGFLPAVTVHASITEAREPAVTGTLP